MTQNSDLTTSKKEKKQKKEKTSDEEERSFIVQSDDSSQSCSFNDEGDYVPSKRKNKRLRIQQIPANSRTLRTRKNVNYAVDVETDEEKETHYGTRKSKRIKTENLILDSNEDNKLTENSDLI
jgi:hypothetical protein